MLKAAAIGHVDIVKTLLEKGVDPRHKDPHGNSPLDKAKLHNN